MVSCLRVRWALDQRWGGDGESGLPWEAWQDVAIYWMWRRSRARVEGEGGGAELEQLGHAICWHRVRCGEMYLLGKISVPLWRSPLSQTRKKSNLRSPSGKKEVRSHSSQEDILLIKWRVYTYVIRHRALLCLRYMVRDQENEGDGGKKWKKSTFLIPNLEASRRDQVPGKWGKCQIPLHLLLRTVEINPELDSANMEWFIFFLTMHYFEFLHALWLAKPSSYLWACSPVSGQDFFNSHPSGKSIRKNWLWHYPV